MSEQLPQIFEDYATLERLAWRMHDALQEACDREKRDPTHLFSVDRMRRIARMDAARCDFEEWSR